MTNKFDSAAHLTLWSKAVDVQQHFNDIGWRIRALGVTILTFTFGATGVAYASSTSGSFLGRETSPAFLVPLLGIVLWGSLWFTDAGWYHRLLVGSVRDALRLEGLLQAHGIDAQLGSAIKEESPIRFFRRRSALDRAANKPRVPRRLFGREMALHSKHKLHAFYAVITIVLFATSVVVFFYPANSANAQHESPPRPAHSQGIPSPISTSAN